MIIIGILAATAIPIFLSQKQKSYDAQAKSDVHSAAIAEESYFADGSSNAFYYASFFGGITNTACL